jgi:chromatin assembly factor 1 subunit B
MLAKVLRIHWHDKQPVFSIDFDKKDPAKLVTAGGDNNIRVAVMLIQV